MSLTTLCLLPAPKRTLKIPAEVRVARVKVHHFSHKAKSILETIAALFVAHEAHTPGFAVVMVVWAVLDFYCLLDRGPVDAT